MRGGRKGSRALALGAFVSDFLFGRRRDATEQCGGSHCHQLASRARREVRHDPRRELAMPPRARARGDASVDDDDDDDDDDDASEDRLDIDLEHSGGLEEYEDEYVEPPSYALGSLTELTQKKAGMKTRGGKKEKKEKARVAFGDASKRIELDD